MRRRIETLTFLLVVLFAPVYLLAQEVLEPAPDLREMGARVIEAVTPVLTVAVVWALKLAWSKIPASFVLFAAPIVGMGLNFLLSYLASNVPADLLQAAALGAVATWIREFASTLIDKGLLKPVTVTKGMI